MAHLDGLFDAEARRSSALNSSPCPLGGPERSGPRNEFEIEFGFAVRGVDRSLDRWRAGDWHVVCAVSAWKPYSQDPTEETVMATIPGPDPDKPLPIPDEPAKEPEREEPEREPEQEPDWKPEKWTPEKEEEPGRKPTPI